MLTSLAVSLALTLILEGLLALLWGVKDRWEWLAYRKWGRDTRPAFLFSLCANGFSYCSGVLLNALIWRVL